MADDELDVSDEHRDQRPSFWTTRRIIGTTVVGNALLLIMAGIADVILSSKRQIKLEPSAPALRTIRVGETIQLGTADGPKDVMVILGDRYLAISNPTLAMVTDVSPSLANQRGRFYEVRGGRFYEVQVAEGSALGKRVLVEERNIDLGRDRPSRAGIDASAVLRGLVCPLMGLTMIVLSGAWITRRRESAARQINDVQETAKRLIRKHANALSVKRLQCRNFDAYGNINDNKWDKEISYFYKTVIFTDLVRAGWLSSMIVSALFEMRGESLPGKLKSLIDNELDAYHAQNPVATMDVTNLDPVAFEAFCIRVLNEDGWQATATQASGDQGIDILASKQGKRAVFQCKKYSSPVGNKAVQEVIAGRAYASADLAFVVSNAGFTKLARELAAKARVHLIHYTELTGLDRYL